MKNNYKAICYIPLLFIFLLWIAGVVIFSFNAVNNIFYLINFLVMGLYGYLLHKYKLLGFIFGIFVCFGWYFFGINSFMPEVEHTIALILFLHLISLFFYKLIFKNRQILVDIIKHKA
ncbi:MAG: hypothetical protein ACK5LY_01105 [Lachnospirales bacterium]